LAGVIAKKILKGLSAGSFPSCALVRSLTDLSTSNKGDAITITENGIGSGVRRGITVKNNTAEANATSHSFLI
jgi:hypothetical protein